MQHTLCSGVLSHLRTIFTPNEQVTKSVSHTISLCYVAGSLLWWTMLPSKILPSPTGVLGALVPLWSTQGLGYAMVVSITTNFQAVAVMTLISLVVSYATALAVCKPLAGWFSAFRFNGFVGLPLVLTLLIADQHWIKVTMLVIGMSVFTVPSIVSMIDQMSREVYDHARVLHMSEWRVLWEVVVLGKFHEVWDILRTNMAVGWMMLPMVEGLFRTEGGVGALILSQNKFFKLEEVYCIGLVVILTGILQDYCVRFLKKTTCPHACINTERK